MREEIQEIQTELEIRFGIRQDTLDFEATLTKLPSNYWDEHLIFQSLLMHLGKYQELLRPLSKPNDFQAGDFTTFPDFMKQGTDEEVVLAMQCLTYLQFELSREMASLTAFHNGA
ncbi:MAG: hypothetical protein HC913_07975 [Microscillaceae bacterium]|nr:hypothetical protein [Microscillaceae bacterium]